MKILLLASLTKSKSGNFYGGAEKTIINLANWLSLHTEHNIILASVEGNECPFIINNAVKYVGYPIQYINKLFTHYQIFCNTLKVLRNEQPDFVISFWIHPLFYGLLYNKIRKIPMIYSERNDPDRYYSKLTKFLRFITLHFCDGIVFQTKGAQQFFSKKIIDKSIVIHNPIYIEKKPISTSFNNRIVTVGRLTAQKNQQLLIKAFANISVKFPDLRLELYGDGDLKENLKILISEYKLSQKVYLMGTCKNILEKIKGARMFILSSLYEGMPNALMEAMSLGIPCISSNCTPGGPSELINDGKNGLLFKNNDQQDLESKILFILQNEDKAKLLGNNAMNIINTHNQDIIFSKWYSYIKGIVS